jgi:hypothetical protein
MQTNVCGRAKEAPSVDVMRGEIVETGLDRLIAKLLNLRAADECEWPEWKA